MAISSANVHLDDTQPECMEGVYRVGSVELQDENGKEIINKNLEDQLVNNDEFHSTEALAKSVAKQIGIDVSHVTIY